MCPSSLKTFIFFLLVFVPWPHFCGHTAVLLFRLFFQVQSCLKKSHLFTFGQIESADICCGKKVNSLFRKLWFFRTWMFCILFTFKFLVLYDWCFLCIPYKNSAVPIFLSVSTTLCTVIFVLDYLIWRKVRYFSSLLCFGQQIKHCIEHK